MGLSDFYIRHFTVDHKERMKNVKTAHSQELHRVKQDVYLLQSKVTEQQPRTNMVKKQTKYVPIHSVSATPTPFLCS